MKVEVDALGSRSLIILMLFVFVFVFLWTFSTMFIYLLVDIKQTLQKEEASSSELRSCVNVEVGVLGSLARKTTTTCEPVWPSGKALGW